MNRCLVAYATSQLQVEPAVLLTRPSGEHHQVPTTVFSGWLSDQYGRKWIYLPTVAVGFRSPSPCSAGERHRRHRDRGHRVRVITAFMYGPQGALFSGNVQHRGRYLGVALGFAVSTTIAAVIVLSCSPDRRVIYELADVFHGGLRGLTFVTGLTITDRPGATSPTRAPPDPTLRTLRRPDKLALFHQENDAMSHPSPSRCPARARAKSSSKAAARGPR